MSDTYIRLITEIIVLIISILLFILSIILLALIILGHISIRVHSGSINKSV